MSGSQPPWEVLSTSSPVPRSRQSSPLPPGAAHPSSQDTMSPPPGYVPNPSYAPAVDEKTPTGPAPIPSSSSMSEFGVASGIQSRDHQNMPSSSSHRALPTPGSGSTGRRPLPVPPRPLPAAVPSIYAQTGRIDPSGSPQLLPRGLPARPPATPPPAAALYDRPPTPPPKISVSHAATDRVTAIRSHTPTYDSPHSSSTSHNGAHYDDYSGSSRQTSLTPSISGMSLSNGSTHTSHTPISSWHDSVLKLDEIDGTGTNITLRPPSTGPPGSSLSDGRRTPTPNNWNDNDDLSRPPVIDPVGRQRKTSTSTIGAGDVSPSTPRMAPHMTLSERLQHEENMGFPVPQVMATPPVDNESTRSSSPGAYSVPSQTFASGSRPAQLQRHDSHSSRDPSIVSSFRSAALSSSWAEQRQEPSSWVQRKLQIHQSRGDDDYDDVSGLDPSLYDGEEDDYGPDEEEEAEVHESRFFQPAFLSEAALQLRDRVERRRQTKAGISWQDSFTGRDIVTTIQSFLPSYTRESPNDRRFALLMAQSLQNQLWFVEVDWDIKPLRDSPEDVFRFMGEMEGMGAGDGINSELPSGLMTMATRCYSPSCPQDSRCYASRCPFRQMPSSFIYMPDPSPTPEASTIHGEEPSDWTGQVDGRILQELTDEQYHRQAIIRQAIQQEVQYSADLTAMEDLYINALRNAQPPIIPHYRLEKFIHEVFSNEAEIREASGRLLDHFTIRERESAQPGLIPFVGDIFLQAAADFRSIYPEYTGNLPHAENVLRQEMEDNADFRFFCDRIVRENDGRRHIKYLITRPSDQLQRTYPAVLESILAITDPTEPDHDFLIEAVSSIQTLSAISQLKLFHASQGRGPAGKKQWHDLVPEDVRKDIPPKEQKRQMQIWELIQGEMEYVADLETMDTLFVDKLRMAENGPIVERSRVEIFLDDAFHNYRSLLEVHQNLLENLQARQLEQHPQVGAIGDLLLDAALNWQDAYMEYVTHYPIAKAKVQEEEMKNTKFAAFLKECLKDPQSHRQDIYHFINRPIPRLLRYNLLLADILKSLRESGLPEDHPDIETIPQVIDLIKDLGRATQKGVAVNESKVELWTYQHSLDGSRFGVRVVRDLDLLNPMRELIHRGRVFRQPEGPMSSWAELTVLLFDNYLVLVKPEKHRSSRREERQERYIINRRPIPLELLSIGQFGDAPRARRDRSRLMGGGGSSHEPESGADPESNKVWPFSISFIGQGQLGGQYTLWSDSYASRAEWQEKLQHAKVLRTEVNDANKVFEMTPLSQDTFYMSYSYAPPKAEGDTQLTGRVTCSCPFATVDGRTLVAIGCEEGVWIGLRNDPHSLRKVLHVKSVTNIAVLEEFGIFLVLQDRSLLAYHLEALVPTASSPQVRAAPQRLSPGKDISFFSVGRLSGRTLVLYMKKKGMDSLFRVLEPISGRNAEDAARQRRPFGNFLGQRTEWFRLYKDFFIPTDALGVHWLKAKLAVVCAKGFEIMDLTDLKGGSIPIFEPSKVRDKPHLAELQRRCDAAKPLGMFRSTETEFLLCYDSFGIYVDRHGEPNRDMQAIEWEGRPDSVAFHPPYVLLVSAPFMEIRHIDTGKLLQIYTGTDIHLTWDGTGGMLHPPQDNPGPKGYGDETASQEPRIHICQRPDDPRRAKGITHGVGQHVFELTPTLALNNPLLNPIHTHDSNYFPPAPMIRSDMRSDNMSDRRRSSSLLTSNSGEFYASQHSTPSMLHMTSMTSMYSTPNPSPPMEPTIHRSPSSQSGGGGGGYAWAGHSHGGMGSTSGHSPYSTGRLPSQMDGGYPSQRQGSYQQYMNQQEYAAAYRDSPGQTRPGGGRPSYESYSSSQDSSLYHYGGQQGQHYPQQQQQQQSPQHQQQHQHPQYYGNQR